MNFKSSEKAVSMAMMMVALTLWFPQVQSDGQSDGLCELECKLRCAVIPTYNLCYLTCIANHCRHKNPKGLGYCGLGCVISTCSGLGNDVDAKSGSRCVDACWDSCGKSYNSPSLSKSVNQKNI